MRRNFGETKAKVEIKKLKRLAKREEGNDRPALVSLRLGEEKCEVLEGAKKSKEHRQAMGEEGVNTKGYDCISC